MIPRDSAPAAPPYWVFAIMLALTLWFTTRNWQATILDRHDFRQLQTATSAYWLTQTGFQLDHELPLFGPPWSIPMEFPVYQSIVAGVSTLLGTGLETTARGVSLFFFLAMLPAVYGLTGLLPLAQSRRLLVVAAVLASPTYLFYARAFMIETTALSLTVWFVHGLTRAVRGPDWRWAAVAAICGSLAALAKVTTFLVFCPPAAALLWWLARQDQTRRLPSLRWLASAGAPVAAALAFGAWWVRYADHVKHSNPYSGFLTSTELAKWNWGSWEQRFSPRFWSEFWNNVSGFVLGEIALAACLVGFTVISPLHRRVALWCAGFFLGGVLLFSNLFLSHDYYYCATAVLLLAGAGVVLAGVWDDTRLPLAARSLLLGLFFGGQILIYHRGYADYTRRELPAPPGIAEVIRATVPADGVVLIHGWDWNSLIPYYAQRRAIMVPHGRENETQVLEDVVGQLPPRRVAALLVQTEPLRGSLSFVRWRTNRFGLSSAPVASSAAGDLYLAEDLLPSALRVLAGRRFPGVEPSSRAGADEFIATPVVVGAGALDLDFLQPRPSGGRTRYGFNAGEADGRPVLSAHAPSELQFSPPRGATRITAEFGLPDAAYSGGAAVSDGVGVEIFERLPNGFRRTLHRRNLDPVHQPADRGPQRIELPDAGPFTGTVVFRFTPGLQDNVVNDWAYWRLITIQ